MKKLKKLRGGGSSGFTLIELIVVIAIIGILAGLIIVRIGNSSRDARNTRRSSDMNQIRNAIEQYKVTGGTLLQPTTGAGAATVWFDLNAVSPLQNGAAVCATATDCVFKGPSETTGRMPSAWLAGGTSYPVDPLGGTNYYQLDVTDANGNYVIRPSQNTNPLAEVTAANPPVTNVSS